MIFFLLEKYFSLFNPFGGGLFSGGGSDRPTRIRPILTLKEEQRHADVVRVRAKNVKGVTSLRLVSTPRPAAIAGNGNQGRPQLANQVLANTTASANGTNGGVDGIIGNTADNLIDVDGTTNDDDEFLTISNPFGSGGECRHNNHCRGSQRCVRRNGKHICTTRYCNVDSDCEDSRLCREQRCRRCRRCRDELQATVPKG